MRLYKDYVEEQERLQKEDEDRKSLGVPKETAIIYEQPKTVSILKSVAGILILILLLMLAGAGIIAMALYLKG